MDFISKKNKALYILIIFLISNLGARSTGGAITESQNQPQQNNNINYNHQIEEINNNKAV